MKRTNLLPALAVVALSLATLSCKQVAPQQAEKEYKVLTVNPTQSQVSNQYTTTIRGKQFVDIRPQISGVITQILINEGAEVKKGETLFIIDQTPYKAAVDVATANVKSAKSTVATAKLNADSSKELLEAGIISETEYQVTSNTLAAAEAALALAVAQEVNAKNDLSYTVIKSPVDGVASMINYRVGALVSSTITDALVSVTNNDQMYAYFSMSEAQILSLTRKMGSTQQVLESMPAVKLLLKDGVAYDLLGKIDAISGTIEQTTGTVSLRALFENPNQMLRDGGSGSIVVYTDMDDVYVIPKIATYEIQDKKFVYKVVDGMAKSAQITVYPIDNGQEFIVTEGLQTGDVLVAEGAGLLRENTPITKTIQVAK